MMQYVLNFYITYLFWLISDVFQNISSPKIPKITCLNSIRFYIESQDVKPIWNISKVLETYFPFNIDFR